MLVACSFGLLYLLPIWHPGNGTNYAVQLSTLVFSLQVDLSSDKEFQKGFQSHVVKMGTNLHIVVSVHKNN